MNVHGSARTFAFSRELLVRRIDEGWTVQDAAEAVGVSERTAYKWLRRARAGEAVQDRSSRPKTSPSATPAELVDLIERLRKQRMTSPQIAKQLRMSRATV